MVIILSERTMYALSLFCEQKIPTIRNFPSSVWSVKQTIFSTCYIVLYNSFAYLFTFNICYCSKMHKQHEERWTSSSNGNDCIPVDSHIIIPYTRHTPHTPSIIIASFFRLDDCCPHYIKIILGK